MQLNFNVPPAIRTERLNICEKCKFYKQVTKSCGTLLLGETVTHYKAKIKLCGCIMPVKTKLRFASCPAGKWSAFNINAHEIDELKEFMKSITGKSKIDQDQAARLFGWKQKITGKREQVTTCGACVRELIDEINKQLDQL